MKEGSMAIDLLADERPRPKPPAHEMGQDLSALSIVELDERVEILQREIERLKERAHARRPRAMRQAPSSNPEVKILAIAQTEFSPLTFS
jgi:uncharacterized small protein (DUF1192 family)